MRKLLIILVLFSSVVTRAQNVAVNNDASLPDNSAILDIKSGTKGLLIPRMNTAAIAAIVNPAKGLLVLDTAKNQLLVNMGTPVSPNWQTIVASSGWSLTGNSGIDSATNFIGTLNTKPLLMRVNNVRAGYLDTMTNNTSFGFRALDSFTVGNSNTAFGFKSLSGNKTGAINTGVGWGTLKSNLSGNSNIAIGYASLQSNQTGNSNVAIGTFALYNSGNRSNLVAIGDSALFNNGIGATQPEYAIGNTAIGSKTLFGNTLGFDNTAVGSTALLSNTLGFRNTALGSTSLRFNTTGFENTATGYETLFRNSTGDQNCAYGYISMTSNVTGISNSAYGTYSLTSNTDGSSNTAIGFGSLYNNMTGYSNVAMGAYALYRAVNRSNLVAIGDSALFNNGIGATVDFEGAGNTAVGSKAMFSNTTGTKNTAIGLNALRSNIDGGANTAVGWGALASNTYAAANTAIGWESLKLNTTGDGNTAIGYASMGNNNTGSLNTSYGFSSLYLNIIGQGNSAHGYYALVSNTSGNNNTSIGYSSLTSNTTGSNNTGVGYLANVASGNLTNATAIGANASVGCNYCLVLGSINGVNGGTSSVNVGIGTTTPVKQLEVIGPASAVPVTLVIGNRGGFGPAALEFVSDYGGANPWRPGYIRSNDGGGFTGVLEFYTNGAGPGNLNGNVKGLEVRIGSANTATGTVGVYSDARLKNNITAFTDGLNVISKINPVQFYYNADAPFNTDRQQVGIIAQELEKFAPYMVEKNKQNGYDDLRSVNNQAYTFLLINAVKEQQQEIGKQQQQIENQQKQIDELKRLVEQLLKK